MTRDSRTGGTIQMQTGDDELQAHLSTMLGRGAVFRDGQREAIEAVVADGSRTLVVQRTGWGKSIVYWIATRVRRDRGHGPTLIVSPLLALMRNQIAMARRLQLRAVTINSANVDEWPTIEAALAADEVDVLFVSAPRFANDDFATRVLPSIQGSIGVFVVDEAHCISDWGHDFVPDYRRIGRLLPQLGPVVSVLGTTATANDRVVADVAAQLGDGVQVIRGSLSRDSLYLDAIPLRDQAERLAWLAEHLPAMPGSGIIYCLTVADTERVAAWLGRHGIVARPYSGDVPTDEQERLEDDLLANRVKALVATVALGMGFDKPDLGFVIHYQRPGSPIAYYQQVGRAGRGMDRAYGIVLSGREDDDIAEYFLATAFPPTARMNEVLATLETVDTASVRDLERRINLPHGQIEKALKLLEIDGAVARDGGRYFRTLNAWQADDQRIEGVLAARRAELQAMQEYVETSSCLMAFLQRQLNDPDAATCGHCANDGGPTWPRGVDATLVHDAQAFLHRDLREIRPRVMWLCTPTGRIAHPNEVGRALSVYGDAGWGAQVRKGKYVDSRYADELVDAAAIAVRSHWQPTPLPQWVAAVPSRDRSALVGDFAERLARALGLPYVEALTCLVGAKAQKDMANSPLQCENARRKLALVPGASVLAGPVLLVDDIVDSGWTLTVAGALLRDAGSGPTFPFALAMATQRGAA